MTRSASLLLVLAASLSAGCSVVVGSLDECTADADCRALPSGEDLVCDTEARICTYKGCADHAACEPLGAGFFCEQRDGAEAKTCVKKSCTAHADCAPLGDDIGCVASVCRSVCAPAIYADATAAADRQVRIGAIIPLTAADGTESPSQRVRRWAIELATNEVNVGTGGVFVGTLTPRKLNPLICDSHSDPTLAERLARHLADGGYPAILTTNTAETARVLPVAKSKGAVVLSVSATATSLSLDVSQNPPTAVDNGGLFFRTAPRDDIQARIIARRLKSIDGSNPPIAVIHEANDYGRGLAAGILAEWPADKVEIAQVDPGSPTAGNFADLSAVSPRFVLVFANAQNAAAIVKKVQEFPGLAKGSNRSYVFGDSATNASLVSALGTDAGLIENAFGALPFVDTQAQAYRDLRSNYNTFRSNPLHGGATAAFDADGTFGPHTYDAYWMVVLAAAKAMGVGGPSVAFTGKALSDRLKEMSEANAAPERTIRVGPSDLRKAFTLWGTGGLTTVNVVGASGAVDFDENGDVGGSFQWCSFPGNPPTFSLANCLSL